MFALDLFAGTGWGVACKKMGIGEVGVENMKEAVASRELNGMDTPYFDVWDGLLDDISVEHELLIASPPCQTFSAAGTGSGRKALETVLGAIDDRYYEDAENLHALGDVTDPRTALVLTPLAHIFRDRPMYVALEQVPFVKVVWEAYAEVMLHWGYSTWVGNMHSEQYGVPQTRRRAVLMARRDGEEAKPPTPTHSKYYPRNAQKLDPGVLPWVSMAQALGWEKDEGWIMRSNYGTGGDPALRGERTEDEPAPTVTSKVDRNIWIKRPTAANEGDETPLEWVHTRPSPTIVGSFAPDVVAAPGYRKPGDGPRQKTPGSVRVTIEQAATLQSYPDGFKFAGSKGKQFLQVGNAVPPLMAEAILGELVS